MDIQRKMSQINRLRRNFLGLMGTLTASRLIRGVAVLIPVPAFAGRNKPAFEATDWRQVLEQLGAGRAPVSTSIVIDAPGIAENGAHVPVSVTSALTNTTSISIIVEHNPTPLVTSMRFAPGVEGFVSTRIKMSQSSKIRVVVLADGKIYTAARDVVVIHGGCG